jgi:low affinity Fe/Cu permease
MVFNESLSEISSNIYPLIADKISPLINIFQFVGIAAIVYLIILIIRGIINIKNARRIKRIEEKLDFIIEAYKLGKNKRTKK